MWCADRAGKVYGIKGEEEVDVGGSEDALVAVAVEAVVGIGIAGHVVTAADTVAVVAH